MRIRMFVEIELKEAETLAFLQTMAPNVTLEHVPQAVANATINLLSKSVAGAVLVGAGVIPELIVEQKHIVAPPSGLRLV